MTQSYDTFKDTIENQLMRHPVIVHNPYTAWFAHGDMSMAHLRHFTVQFSVFSNQFLLAALNRVINADTLQGARKSKEILMNELGVVYNRGTKNEPNGGNGRLTSTEKAIPSSLPPKAKSKEEPSGFRLRTSNGCCVSPRHSDSLSMTWASARHGTASTISFCDELFHLYGSDDYNEALGAAFAVENWAAAGFWKELINGLDRIKREKLPALHLAFFTWHDKIEDQHKGHVWDELAECYHSPQFREEPFIRAGLRMLDGVKTFWDGLDRDRRKAEASGFPKAG